MATFAVGRRDFFIGFGAVDKKHAEALVSEVAKMMGISSTSDLVKLTEHIETSDYWIRLYPMCLK